MRRKGYSMIHFIKRAFLSVIRKPAKSIILMMTIFFLSNLIAGSYAISTSTRNSLDDLKEALGARLTFHSKTHYDGFSNNDKTAIEMEKYVGRRNDELFYNRRRGFLPINLFLLIFLHNLLLI